MILPVGDVLTGIYYEISEFESPPSPASPVDEVWMALTLRWQTSPATRISCSSDPEQEGLLSGGPWEGGPKLDTVLTDVSDRWSRLVGKRLVRYSFSHFFPPIVLPWAVKLCFEASEYLVVMLGELGPEGPVGMPDSLLVTGSREVARSLRPEAAFGCAWGDDDDEQ
jgi:hypothetical protein